MAVSYRDRGGDKLIHDNGPESLGQTSKECKPDYEQMIIAAKKAREKTAAFIEAIFAYTGERSLRDKMAELVGELVSEERQMAERIEKLIRQHEANE